MIIFFLPTLSATTPQMREPIKLPMSVKLPTKPKMVVETPHSECNEGIIAPSKAKS